MHFIYEIKNLINNKLYVGQTKDPAHRWSSHKSQAKRGKLKYPIYNAINKYGIDNFSFEIICCCATRENCDVVEEIIINQYDLRNIKFGYNLKPGGNSTSGWHHSEETKDKISKSNSGPRPEFRGENNSFFGKKHSEEVKEINRLAHLGKPLSEETKQKISFKSASRTYGEETKEKHRQYRLGRKHSEETKKKISEAQQGRGYKIVNGKRVYFQK